MYYFHVYPIHTYTCQTFSLSFLLTSIHQYRPRIENHSCLRALCSTPICKKSLVPKSFFLFPLFSFFLFPLPRNNCNVHPNVYIIRSTQETYNIRILSAADNRTESRLGYKYNTNTVRRNKKSDSISNGASRVQFCLPKRVWSGLFDFDID